MPGKAGALAGTKVREQGSERMSGKSGPLAGSKAREQGRRKAPLFSSKGRGKLESRAAGGRKKCFHGKHRREKHASEKERKEAREATYLQWHDKEWDVCSLVAIEVKHTQYLFI